MRKLSPNRKNKINLEDYDYQRDIENRLLMSQFSTFDVEVLEEILHSSLTIHLSDLAEALGQDLLPVMEVVDKLSQTKLVKRVGEVIEVDKEMRKYYEFQILKFDDKFEPNMDFLQGLLRKVPIHALPIWYATPRTATNIFDSIVERYLATPRLYQRYLLELNFEDPVLTGIMNDVFTAPDFTLRSRELREKYHLTREEVEEVLLILEFNFICCLSYRQIGDQWKEVVTPFYEWREFLRFQRDTKPEPLPPEAAVEERRGGALPFAKDLKILLTYLLDHDLDIEEDFDAELYRIDVATLEKLAKKGEGLTLKGEELERYFSWLIDKALLLNLAELDEEKLKATDETEEWVTHPIEDQALALYRHPDNTITTVPVSPSLSNERNLREIEKALFRCAGGDWVYFDDFLKGVYAPIGERSETSLRKKGRRWAYVRPTYSPEEKAFIQAAIMERFFEAGFVSTGLLGGRSCFRVTPFGRTMLSLV
ncbi:MAG: hypothetical protein AB7F31_01145 [Parachlamydiales bacterium]